MLNRVTNAGGVRRIYAANGKPEEFFEFRAAADDRPAEILIFSHIGEELFGGVSSQAFVRELMALGDVDEINVRINSEGGNVQEALGMYYALVKHDAKVIVDIEGVAASAASMIAMAGEHIRIGESAYVMVHLPHAMVIGNMNELRAAADQLEEVSHNFAKLYADRAKRDEASVMEMMQAETWLRGQAAIDAGFAEELIANLAVAACVNPALMQFQKAPEELVKPKAEALVDVTEMRSRIDGVSRYVAGLESPG